MTKTSMLPAYREFQPRERPVSDPSERCPEPGCTKTVREHIAEFKAHGRKIEQRAVCL